MVRSITLAQNFESAGKTAIEDLAAKQPQELLLLLSGILAVLLSVVLLGIHLVQGLPSSQAPAQAVIFVANLVLGGAMLVASRMVQSNLPNGALMAGVVSVILIWYGGQPGVIGGAVGLLGAIVAAAIWYRTWLRKP